MAVLGTVTLSADSGVDGPQFLRSVNGEAPTVLSTGDAVEFATVLDSVSGGVPTVELRVRELVVEGLTAQLEEHSSKLVQLREAVAAGEVPVKAPARKSRTTGGRKTAAKRKTAEVKPVESVVVEDPAPSEVAVGKPAATDTPVAAQVDPVVEGSVAVSPETGVTTPPQMSAPAVTSVAGVVDAGVTVPETAAVVPANTPAGPHVLGGNSGGGAGFQGNPFLADGAVPGVIPGVDPFATVHDDDF